MQSTYTFTARNAEKPTEAMTFTLQDGHMLVRPGAPLEPVETAVRRATGKEDEDQAAGAKPWLKPVAVSLVEKGVGPFRVEDVTASSSDEHLNVRAWYRALGLALLPVTLMDARVDNPQAATGFAEEVARRKDSLGGSGAGRVLEFWATWIVAAVVVVAFLGGWRRRSGSS